eukprot:Gb_04835 [translate_table: standard]
MRVGEWIFEINIQSISSSTGSSNHWMTDQGLNPKFWKNIGSDASIYGFPSNGVYYPSHISSLVGRHFNYPGMGIGVEAGSGTCTSRTGGHKLPTGALTCAFPSGFGFVQLDVATNSYGNHVKTGSLCYCPLSPLPCMLQCWDRHLVMAACDDSIDVFTVYGASDSWVAFGESTNSGVLSGFKVVYIVFVVFV